MLPWRSRLGHYATTVQPVVALFYHSAAGLCIMLPQRYRLRQYATIALSVEASGYHSAVGWGIKIPSSSRLRHDATNQKVAGSIAHNVTELSSRSVALGLTASSKNESAWNLPGCRARSKRKTDILTAT
jgi:hypothetical protein